jgi:hypothetical protein
VKRRSANRTLPVITDELSIALKRETSDISIIGGLLVEARTQLNHGRWYEWLRENFSLSRQSADRYVKLHKALVKTPKISDLKLRPTLLDQLFLRPPKRSFLPEVREAILAEAITKWVGLTWAYEIEREIKRENEAIERGEFVLPPWEEEPEAEQDRPLPDLPPALPALLPRDEFLISTFANAIKMLKATLTKPAAKFALLRIRLVTPTISR